MKKTITILNSDDKCETHQIETDDIENITEKEGIITITQKDNKILEFKALTNKLPQISSFIFNKERTLIDLSQDLNKKYFPWHFQHKSN